MKLKVLTYGWGGYRVSVRRSPDGKYQVCRKWDGVTRHELDAANAAERVAVELRGIGDTDAGAKAIVVAIGQIRALPLPADNPPPFPG